MTKSNKKTAAPQVQTNDDELNAIPTVSGKIRYLHSKEFTRSAIAVKLNIRYQHVRNVLTTQLKRQSV